MSRALRWLVIALLLGSLCAHAAGEHGRYARIAFLRPLDGDTVDFEAGYIRHLEWHRQANDSFVWYGWSIWSGDRQRWFVYATFGHEAGDFDHPVSPADDERDTVVNVTPHAQFAGSALYEFLPPLSHGSENGVPSSSPRVEMTTVELVPGSEKRFESAIASIQARLNGETLWYRMIAGGATPRYLRLRPRSSLSALIEEEGSFPDVVHPWMVKTTVEILNLRPAMSLGVK